VRYLAITGLQDFIGTLVLAGYVLQLGQSKKLHVLVSG
jgi:hypothetical protein